MNDPLITIGVPTYERPEGLKKALTSLIHQSYKDFTVIISDNDSSNKEVGEVAKEFCDKDSRFHYYKQTLNRGPVNNFQYLFDIAKTKYFIWLADDDYWNTTFLEDSVNQILETGDILVAPLAVYSDGSLVTNLFLSREGSEINRIRAYFQNVVGNSSFYGLMDRSKISDFKIQNCMGGDWIWIADVLSLGKISVINTAIIYLQKSGSGSYKNIAKTLGISKWKGLLPHLSLLIEYITHVFTCNTYSHFSFFKKNILSLCVVYDILLIRVLLRLKYKSLSIMKYILPKSMINFLKKYFRVR